MGPLWTRRTSGWPLFFILTRTVVSNPGQRNSPKQELLVSPSFLLLLSIWCPHLVEGFQATPVSTPEPGRPSCLLASPTGRLPCRHMWWAPASQGASNSPSGSQLPPSFKPLLPKMWSPGQQCQHQGACEKCRVPGFTAPLPNQALCVTSSGGILHIRILEVCSQLSVPLPWLTEDALVFPSCCSEIQFSHRSQSDLLEVSLHHSNPYFKILQ